MKLAHGIIAGYCIVIFCIGVYIIRLKIIYARRLYNEDRSKLVQGNKQYGFWGHIIGINKYEDFCYHIGIDGKCPDCGRKDYTFSAKLTGRGFGKFKMCKCGFEYDFERIDN